MNSSDFTELKRRMQAIAAGRPYVPEYQAAQCQGKHRYPDYVTAQCARRPNTPAFVRPYRCGVCRGWHLGAHNR